MSSIMLREEDYAIMYDHAEREFPNESCGLIIGDLDDLSKTEVRPCANIQHLMKEKYPDQFQRDADTGYFMDPKEVRVAFEDAGKKQLQVIGFYHSHPNHDAYWSDEDHRAAMWAGTEEPSFPDAANIVISVYDGKVKGSAMFCWNDETKKFERSHDHLI